MSTREAWQVTDDAAELYEASFVPGIFGATAATMAELLAIGGGDRVLDVGCGTGILAREAAKHVGPQGRVAGLDLNPRMLEVARRIAPDIEWHEGDAGSLPFEEGSFDVVGCQYALMFVPDRAAALSQMWRVLAPGGRLGAVVCGPVAEAEGYAILGEVAEEVCTPEVVALLRSPFVLGDQGLLAAAFRDAGIAGVRIETRPTPVRFPSIDALVHTEVKASPIREVIDEASFAALLEGARERLAHLCGPKGEVRFPMPVHIATATR